MGWFRWNSWYSWRWLLMRPVRLTIRGLAWLISQIPGTTNGERAEMSLVPCPRCVGHRVVGVPVAQILK